MSPQQREGLGRSRGWGVHTCPRIGGVGTAKGIRSLQCCGKGREPKRFLVPADQDFKDQPPVARFRGRLWQEPASESQQGPSRSCGKEDSDSFSECDRQVYRDRGFVVA